MPNTIFDRYPQLATLKGLVPDSLVEREIGASANEFERELERARQTIPTVNLNGIFPPALEKGRIRLENFLGHWGNVAIEELCKICLIVKFIQPKRILEIGTYNGMTTLQMALNAPPHCQTYTLDLPKDQYAALPMSELDMLVSKHFREKFGTSTGSYFRDRPELNITQLLGDSAVFDYATINGPLDIIFIDAAHDYANKKVDSENAFARLAQNGVILWHNYADVSCPEVTRYLADISRGRKIFHLRNTSLAVYYGGA